MTLTAEAVSASEVRLRLSGSAQEKTHLMHGVIVYDLKKQNLTRFDLMWFSPWGERDFAPEGVEATYSPIGVAFELTPSDKPIDRLYPHLWTQFWRDDHRPIRKAYFATGE